MIQNTYLRYILEPVDKGSRQLLAQDKRIRQSVQQTDRAMRQATRDAVRQSQQQVQSASRQGAAHTRAGRQATAAAQTTTRAASQQTVAWRRATTATTAHAASVSRASAAETRASASSGRLRAALTATAAAYRRMAAAATQAGRAVTASGAQQTRVGGSARMRAGGMGFAVGRGGAGGVAAAAAGFGLVAAVAAGASFEKQMDRVQAVSQATTAEMRKLNEQAKQLGADTEFSAKQAADGMYQLSTAGFKAGEVMKIIPGTLDLAAASATDLASAAEIQAAAIRGFGLAATDATRVADILTQTVNSSAVEMYDLQESIKYIAPVANASGQSIEHMMAAVALMGNVGIKGSQAGTTLRTAIVRLTDPPAKAAAALKELGIRAGELRGPKGLLPLPQIMQKIVTGAQDMDKGTRNAALAAIFGREALSGMVAMVEAGPGAMQRTIKALEQSEGAARKSAATMRDNVAGAWDVFTGSVETASIALFEKFQPALKEGLKGAAEFVNELTEGLTGKGGKRGKPIEVTTFEGGVETTRFERPPEEKSGVQRFGEGVRKAASTAGKAIGQVVKEVGPLIGELLAAFKPMQPFIENVIFPLLIGFGKGILATIVIALKIAIPIIRVFATVLGAIGKVMRPLRPVLEIVGQAIALLFGGAILKAIGGVAKLASAFPRLTGVIRFLGRVLSPLNALFRLFGRVVAAAFGAAIKVVGAAARGIGGGVRALVGVIGRVLGTVVRIVTTPHRLAFRLVLSIIRGAGGRVGGAARAVVNGLRAAFGVVRRVILNPIRAAFNAVVGVIRGAIGKVSGAAKAVADGLLGAFKGIAGKVKGLVGGVVGVLKDVVNGIGSALNVVIKAINSIPDVHVPEVKIKGVGFGGADIGIPDIPEIPQVKRGGGLIGRALALLSPGEVGVEPSGRSWVVPGRPVAADNVLAAPPVGTAVLTGHGQALMAAGATLAEAIAHQLPHFAAGGLINDPDKRKWEGKFSVFGPPLERAGTTAMGVSSARPGIATRNRATLGHVFDVYLRGKRAHLRQIDLGPARWTGRDVDVTGAGARQLGFNPRRFPTDARGEAEVLSSRVRRGERLGRVPEERVKWREIGLGALSAAAAKRILPELLRPTLGGESAFGTGFQAALSEQIKSLFGTELLADIYELANVPIKQRERTARELPGRKAAEAGGSREFNRQVGDVAKKGNVLRGVSSILVAANKAFGGLGLMSGFRPGSRTRGGRPSNHGRHFAIDIGKGKLLGPVGNLVGGLNRRVGAWVAQRFPAGLRGVSEPIISLYSGPGALRDPRDHWNHVHMASSRKSAIPRAASLYQRLRGGGLVGQRGGHVPATLRPTSLRGFQLGGVAPARRAGVVALNLIRDDQLDPKSPAFVGWGLRRGGIVGLQRGGHVPGTLRPTALRGMGGAPQAVNLIEAVARAGARAGTQVKRWLERLVQVIDNVDSAAANRLRARIRETNEAIVAIRRGGVTRRERPELRGLMRSRRQLEAALATARRVPYESLVSIAAGIRAEIRGMARGGLTRRERAQTRRLRAALGAVEAEMGRRTGLMVVGVEQMVSGLERGTTHLQRMLRFHGVEEASSKGQAALARWTQTQVKVLQNAERTLVRAFQQARRQGDQDAMKEIASRLGDVREQLADTVVTWVEQVRQAQIAAAQEKVETAAFGTSAVRAQLEQIELRQRLAGTFETGGAQRAAFIRQRLLPKLSTELKTLTDQLATAKKVGDSNLARQIAEAIWGKQSEILQAQLEAQEATASNTEALKEFGGTMAFEAQGQDWVQGLVGVGVGA